MKKTLLHLLTFVLLHSLSAQTETLQNPPKNLEACDVVWTSLGQDSQDSMPLGNGDIGLNVWTEANAPKPIGNAEASGYSLGFWRPALAIDPKDDAKYKGFRYTPDNTGDDCKGVEIGTLQGGIISPSVPDLTWEFWEQQ